VSITKATRHVNQNEGLIFEKSSPGKAAWKLPPLDVPEWMSMRCSVRPRVRI